MTAKSQYKQLCTIFVAIAAALALFFVAAYALGKYKGALLELDAAQMQYLKTLVLLFAFAGIPAAHYYHKKRSSNIDHELSGREKLLRFRTSYAIKLVTFEGLGFVSLLAYLLSNDKTFLIVFGLFMVVVVINYPSKSKVAEELQTSEEELFGDDATDRQ